LWPLSIDGLLLLATVGLLKPGRDASRRTRYVAWTAFLLGTAVSAAANIAAPPTLGWQEILVAGWGYWSRRCCQLSFLATGIAPQKRQRQS
jgi:hypothetical protein